MVRLVLVLDNECDPLQLRQEALAGARPLLKLVARVADGRVVDLVSLYRVQTDFFAIEVVLVLDHALGDEEVESLKQHGQRPVEAVFVRGHEELELGRPVTRQGDL